MIDRAIAISDFRNNRAEDQIRSETTGPIVSLGEQRAPDKRGNARAHVDNEKLASVRTPVIRSNKWFVS